MELITYDALCLLDNGLYQLLIDRRDQLRYPDIVNADGSFNVNCCHCFEPLLVGPGDSVHSDVEQTGKTRTRIFACQRCITHGPPDPDAEIILVQWED